MTIDTIAPRDHHGLSILIVDDNKFTRDLVRKILVSYGIADVASAASGEDALRQLHASFYDLVICDIVMDGMSGIQFVKAIRCKMTPIVNATTMPIIMLTAHADETLVMAAMKAGANGYLVKPLVPSRLTHLIEKLCHSTLPTLRCDEHVTRSHVPLPHH